MNTLAFIGSIGTTELLVLALLGLLIFGRRLPEVGRSLGKGIVEFKKGLAGIEDDVDKSTKAAPPTGPDAARQIPPAAPTSSTTAASETRTPQA